MTPPKSRCTCPHNKQPRSVFSYVFIMPRAIPAHRIFQAVSVFLTLLSQVPPPITNSLNRVRALMQILFPFLMFLISLPNPSPSLIRIMQRLDPGFVGFQYRGRNLFVEIENQRYLFWLNTGELPETLLHITTRVSVQLSRLNRRGRLRQRKRNSKLSNINKVLLTFMWIRKYPCLDTLALMFDVSPSTASNIIYSVVQILWQYFHNRVSVVANVCRMECSARELAFFPRCSGVH